MHTVTIRFAILVVQSLDVFLFGAGHDEGVQSMMTVVIALGSVCNTLGGYPLDEYRLGLSS